MDPSDNVEAPTAENEESADSSDHDDVDERLLEDYVNSDDEEYVPDSSSSSEDENVDSESIEAATANNGDLEDSIESDDVDKCLLEDNVQRDDKEYVSDSSPSSDDEYIDRETDDNLSVVIPLLTDTVEVNDSDANKTEGKRGIYVVRSQKTREGRRIWNKKHACVYCSRQYSKLARHLEQVHGQEIEVKRALAYDKKSSSRKSAWKNLMNKGDFAHNTQVYKQGKGEIIPCKRPRLETPGTQYVQCKECLGTYQSSDLWRHVKNAHPKKKSLNCSKISHQVESASLLPVSSAAKQDFRENILDRMANDEISLIARSDIDIVTFGQRQFQKQQRNHHQFNYIRQKMRELARFVQAARAGDASVTTLRDCIDPGKFHICVKAVKSLCGYNTSNMMFDTPSLAKKIGHSLHTVARKIRTEGITEGNKDLKEKAVHFIEVYKEEWEIEVSHAALETLYIQKYNKPKRIPLAQDLQKLTVHLKAKADRLSEVMADNAKVTPTQWRDLCELTLAQVVLFNKRRAGEAERLEVGQFVDGVKHGKTMQEEVVISLSPLEQKLAEVIDRVELRGKRGRRVAILLPQSLRKQLDILLKNRSHCNIMEENKYIFARQGNTDTPVRATDVLRKYATECGAKQPELLTSTAFRKHIAMISQMLNLKEHELDVLADFLGHDIRIHREFYRLPEDTIQVSVCVAGGGVTLLSIFLYDCRNKIPMCSCIVVFFSMMTNYPDLTMIAE